LTQLLILLVEVVFNVPSGSEIRVRHTVVKHQSG
jgi:hypothetical protein